MGWQRMKLSGLGVDWVAPGEKSLATGKRVFRRNHQ